jgi:hypothetical protein
VLSPAVVLCLALALASSAWSLQWSGEAAVGSPGWSLEPNWAGVPPSLVEPVALEFPRLAGASCASASPSETCYESKNDVGDVAVESLSIDDGDEYELTGDEITLGSGGLAAFPGGGTSGPAGDFLGLPIELGASQAWTVLGRSGGAIGENGVFVEGDVTGASKMLTVDVGNGSAVYLGNDIEVGSVAFGATNTNEPDVLSGFIGLLGGEINSEDGGSVSLSHIFLVGSGAVGSLATSDAELGVGSGNPAGGIQAQSVTLDAASEVEFEITGSGDVAETDYAQLASNGPVRLNGSSVGVVVAPTSGNCPELTAGRTYTLISTTGGLSGSFGDAEEGAELPLRYAKGCAKQTSKHLQIAYHESGATQTVTATIIETGGLPPPIQHYNPYERPNAEGATWGPISSALAVAEAKAAERKASEEAALRARALAEASSGEVSFAGTGIAVQSDGMALVKLGCKGGESCGGKLTLSVQEASEGRGRSRTAPIGAASFLIAAGKMATVRIKLDATGRALLRTAHGHLGARLTIHQSVPMSHAQTRTVRLLQQKARRRRAR